MPIVREAKTKKMTMYHTDSFMNEVSHEIPLASAMYQARTPVVKVLAVSIENIEGSSPRPFKYPS